MKTLNPMIVLLLLLFIPLQAGADVGPRGAQLRNLDRDMVGHWKSSNVETRGNVMIRTSSSLVLRPDGGYASFSGGGYFKRNKDGQVTGGGRGGAERGRWAVRDGHFYLMPEGKNKWVHKGVVEKDDDQIAIISPDGSHTLWYHKRPPVAQRMQRPQRPQRPLRQW